MHRVLIALALALTVQFGCGDGGTHRLPPPGDGDADADADTDADSDADGDADNEPVCLADDDGDGYGVGIRGGCLGPDCDDNDPNAWDDCSSCPDGLARRDCPCEGNEVPVDCHSTETFLDDHGRLRCKTGEMACEAGPDPGTFFWGVCHFEDGTSE